MSSENCQLNVAVVLLHHMSNFTDFDILERDERVNLFYTNNSKDFAQADIIIIPGTKATLDDLMQLRKDGMASAIIQAHKEGKMVIGICGGYQILGQTVSDPDGVEGSIPQLPGLGLLPIHTIMTPEKTTQTVTFQFNNALCKGYEIHQGRSTSDEQVLIKDNCIGTYIHGFLDNPSVIDFLLSGRGEKRPVLTPEQFKEEQYDLLAQHFREYVDMDKLYQILLR